MWSSMFLPHLMLGLLSSLIVAATSVPVAPKGVPILSTLPDPFTLRSRQPKGFHVVVNGDGTPVATADKRASTQFRLTDGKLTVLDSELAAVYGPVGLPLPPRLIPIRFSKTASPHAIAPFVAETNKDPQHPEANLTLTALGDPLVVRIPLGVQNPIYVKPAGNIAPTDHLVLDILPVQKAATDCHDDYDGQEFFVQEGYDL